MQNGAISHAVAMEINLADPYQAHNISYLLTLCYLSLLFLACAQRGFRDRGLGIGAQGHFLGSCLSIAICAITSC